MAHISTEIVVPVHDQTRPIRRAVESLLKDNETRALVIAHNIDPDVLDLPEHERVRIIQLNEHPGKPGACFDAGIAAATAEWVGIMGSDDWYEDGALQTMRKRAAEDQADGVIAPLTHQFLEFNQIKPLTTRTKNLQAARDRMFYRTAPLGIFKTTIMQDPKYKFGPEFPAGSDMRVTALLWTSGLSFSYYWNDPAYVVGKDAQTRVTFTPRPLEYTGAPYVALFEEPEVQAFDKKTKHALAVKMARVHVLSATSLRPTADLWQEGDFEWLTSYVRQLRAYDPAFDTSLSKRDQDIIRAVESGDFEATLAAITAWKSRGLKDRALPSMPLAGITEPDSNLRWFLTSQLRRLKSGKIR